METNFSKGVYYKNLPTDLAIRKGKGFMGNLSGPVHLRIKGRDLESVPKPLVVYEAVIKFGPISHEKLYHKVGYSRSSTFRALRHLETAGWIRKLVNNHHYVATAYVDELAASGSTSLAQLDIVSYAISHANLDHSFTFSVGFYITKRTFCILESSSKLQRPNELEYPFESCAALTAYCHFNQGWDEKTLFNPDIFYNDYDRKFMKKRLSDCRRNINRRGFHFCRDEFSASIGIKFDSSFVGSITLKTSNVNKTIKKKFINNIQTIRSIMEKEGFLA